MRALSRLLLAALSCVGCASTHVDDGPVPPPPQDCETDTECEMILDQAQQRVDRCSENGREGAACNQARKDYFVVKATVDRFRAKEYLRIVAREEEEERRRRYRAEIARQEDEQKRVQNEREVVAAREEARLDFYRGLAFEDQLQLLIQCRRAGIEKRSDLGIERDCDELLADLITLASTDAEKSALQTADQRAKASVERENKTRQAEEKRQDEALAKQIVVELKSARTQGQ